MVSAASLVNEPFREHYARVNPSFEFRTLAHLPAAHIAGVQGYFVNATYWGGYCVLDAAIRLPQVPRVQQEVRNHHLLQRPAHLPADRQEPLVTDQFDTLDHAISARRAPGQGPAAGRAAEAGAGNNVAGADMGPERDDGQASP